MILTQQLVMTPQLQQAIKLLQLTRLELVEAINEEMEENPVLEEQLEGDSDECMVLILVAYCAPWLGHV